MSAVRLEDLADGFSPYLGLVRDELVQLESGAPAPPVARLVHDAFAGMVNSPSYACVGGKAAFSRGTYRVGMFGALGVADSASGLAEGLANFEGERASADNDFFTYVAHFTGPVPMDERRFEQALWEQLRQLHRLDHEAWDPGVSADPTDAHFSFSFGGHAYFVIGLHGASSRWSRRFAWPTLVFNPHDQFEELREDGRMPRWQEVIRERDTLVQGNPNPNLGDFGDLPEARQYSGRRVPLDWKCPFDPSTP
ncbi:MAG: guanitoxin biosynthesis heme-dependent pre-guanitoxin N-hydroxylase GntA [Candidatus Dormibacteria bacterium]